MVVWLVFRDDRFDYRVLALGALAPDVIDVFFGGAWFFHSVTVSVAVMLIVMMATRGQRVRRSRLLAFPIGMFLHLVVDGAFASTDVFWWPFTGLDNPNVELPSLARGWWNIPFEIAGLALIAFLWRRHELGDPARRALFRSSGRLVEPSSSEPRSSGQRDVGQC